MYASTRVLDSSELPEDSPRVVSINASSDFATREEEDSRTDALALPLTLCFVPFH